MGKLSPSHPVARYGPPWLRDKIDVMGSHLIWQGAMANNHSRTRSYATHTISSNDDKVGISVVRYVWGLITGKDLSDDEILWKRDSCIHNRCVSHKCHELLRREDYMLRVRASRGDARRKLA